MKKKTWTPHDAFYAIGRTAAIVAWFLGGIFLGQVVRGVVLGLMAVFGA